jgi:hypothetical protein
MIKQSSQVNTAKHVNPRGTKERLHAIIKRYFYVLKVSNSLFDRPMSYAVVCMSGHIRPSNAKGL